MNKKAHALKTKSASKAFGAGILRVLGPGLVTGAADDDPSGIATYSQAGAQFGFSITWTLLFTYPLTAAIQEISARVGRTTGRGIAANLRGHYPGWVVQIIVALLLGANVINIGSDLGAMGDAVWLLIGGPKTLYVVLFAIICAALQIFVHYSRYVAVLKWMTLSLFAYFGTILVVHVPWIEVARGLFNPTLYSRPCVLDHSGRDIRHHHQPLFVFWQASLEVEEIADVPKRQPLVELPKQGPDAIKRIKSDTYVGMAFSNLVGLAIMVTTAATLHAASITNIQTSSQAAQALKPLAGEFAFVVFSLGIIGTGLLAIPALAGSAAYALGETWRWPVGLARNPMRAKGFYGTILVATILGCGICFSPLDPISSVLERGD